MNCTLCQNRWIWRHCWLVVNESVLSHSYIMCFFEQSYFVWFFGLIMIGQISYWLLELPGLFLELGCSDFSFHVPVWSFVSFHGFRDDINICWANLCYFNLNKRQGSHHQGKTGNFNIFCCQSGKVRKFRSGLGELNFVIYFHIFLCTKTFLASFEFSCNTC